MCVGEERRRGREGEEEGEREGVGLGGWGGGGGGRTHGSHNYLGANPLPQKTKFITP